MMPTLLEELYFLFLNKIINDSYFRSDSSTVYVKITDKLIKLLKSSVYL